MANKKNNPWKQYELKLDPELAAVYADGEYKQCHPHGKYPTPLMLDLIVDLMWAEHPEGSWSAGTDMLSLRWRAPPADQMVRLCIFICPVEKRVFINILSPAREKYLDAASAAGSSAETIKAALAEWAAAKRHHTETLH